MGQPYVPFSHQYHANGKQFLKMNPNGRIPTLTDTFTDGETINLFESGSIMEYLVDRYDSDHKISFPKGTRDWYAMKNWLYFQNAGVGPMQGQASKYNFPYAFSFWSLLFHGSTEIMWTCHPLQQRSVTTLKVVSSFNTIHGAAMRCCYV